jgi:transcriptional regulator with XRE-family HTH domain
MVDLKKFPPSPIRAWLAKHHVSQAELAALLDVALFTVSRWTRDVVRPPDEQKILLAEVTRVWEHQNQVPGRREPIRGIPVSSWYHRDPKPRISRKSS